MDNKQNGVSKGGHPLWPPEAIRLFGNFKMYLSRKKNSAPRRRRKTAYPARLGLCERLSSLAEGNGLVYYTTN